MLRSNLIATIVTLLLLFAQAHANQALMKKLVHDYQKNTKSHLPSQGPCTPDKLVVRKEWYVFPLSMHITCLIMLLIMHQEHHRHQNQTIIHKRSQMPG